MSVRPVRWKKGESVGAAWEEEGSIEAVWEVKEREEGGRRDVAL